MSLFANGARQKNQGQIGWVWNGVFAGSSSLDMILGATVQQREQKIPEERRCFKSVPLNEQSALLLNVHASRRSSMFISESDVRCKARSGDYGICDSPRTEYSQRGLNSERNTPRSSLTGVLRSRYYFVKRNARPVSSMARVGIIADFGLQASAFGARWLVLYVCYRFDVEVQSNNIQTPTLFVLIMGWTMRNTRRATMQKCSLHIRHSSLSEIAILVSLTQTSGPIQSAQTNHSKRQPDDDGLFRDPAVAGTAGRWYVRRGGQTPTSRAPAIPVAMPLRNPTTRMVPLSCRQSRTHQHFGTSKPSYHIHGNETLCREIILILQGPQRSRLIAHLVFPLYHHSYSLTAEA